MRVREEKRLERDFGGFEGSCGRVARGEVARTKIVSGMPPFSRFSVFLRVCSLRVLPPTRASSSVSPSPHCRGRGQSTRVVGRALRCCSLSKTSPVGHRELRDNPNTAGLVRWGGGRNPDVGGKGGRGSACSKGAGGATRLGDRVCRGLRSRVARCSVALNRRTGPCWPMRGRRVACWRTRGQRYLAAVAGGGHWTPLITVERTLTRPIGGY